MHSKLTYMFTCTMYTYVILEKALRIKLNIDYYTEMDHMYI